jgi:hypothetical protein
MGGGGHTIRRALRYEFGLANSNHTRPLPRSKIAAAAALIGDGGLCSPLIVPTIASLLRPYPLFRGDDPM